jgi:hypothetical protein
MTSCPDCFNRAIAAEPIKPVAPVTSTRTGRLRILLGKNAKRPIRFDRRTPLSYGWVTLGFFLISLLGHWLFGWFAYVDQQQAHQQPVEISQYAIEMTRDTLENWQSEFLQLLWQVGGLALLLFCRLAPIEGRR